MARMTSGWLIRVLVVIFMLAGGATVGVKLYRDQMRFDAFHQMQLLGFHNTVTSVPDKGVVVSFVAPTRELTEREMSAVMDSLKVIDAHENIEVVDFSQSNISENARTKLKLLLPRSEVRVW